MSRILLLEPDASVRALVGRVLAAEQHVVVEAATGLDAARALATEPVDVALVDAGDDLALVRAIRRDHPGLPVLVTGALLTTRVLAELVRLGAVDVLAKPFTPDALREVVARSARASSEDRLEGLELDAAVRLARAALVDGDLAAARASLARASSVAPLDAEVVALHGLLAELEGRDRDADRAYRAALALADDEETIAPAPREGLARLAAYGDSLPLIVEPPAGAKETVTFEVGVIAPGKERVAFREGARRVFAIVLGSAAARDAPSKERVERVEASS